MLPSSPLDPFTETPDVDHFIVCGLGSLGQYCVFNLMRFTLKSFEIHITAIEKVNPSEWEIPELPDFLKGSLLIGDCRDDQMLLKAGIQTCRAVLLVTSSDTVNVEAAIAARRLNPEVRLVVRSSRQNLNQLLRQQLGNFVALEPTGLPATAFALAGLGTEILGYFSIADCQLQVVKQQIQPKDYRFDGFPTSLLHKRNYRLLSYHAADQPATPLTEHTFYHWHPDTVTHAGDTIAYIEALGQTPTRLQINRVSRSYEPSPQTQRSQSIWRKLHSVLQTGIRAKSIELVQWIQAQRNYKTVGIGLLAAFCLWMLATVLLKTNVEGMTWTKAISNGAILLLGGYGDVFGGIEAGEADDIPAWINFVCLSITITSFLFILGVFGFIAESLLSSQFDFLRKRFPIPKRNHVVIIGLGQLGRQVTLLLRQFKQPVVAITEQQGLSKLLTDIPVIVGEPIAELQKVNLASAKSVMVLTDDQMFNLEVALIARDAAKQNNREINLVIRTFNQRFSENLHQIFPDAKAMAAYALSAEAFAGAAFGENILSLFRLNDRTILVTEYTISEHDTLVGKLLSEIAYGYGVVPIFHQKPNQILSADITEFLMPSDDIRLTVGDRLVILASLNGLRRIEHGEQFARQHWRLEAQKPLNTSYLLDASSILHRISGYNLDASRAFMNALPNSLELRLYNHQAHRLIQELSRYIPAVLLPVEPALPQ
ncbi:MAG: potassium transporter TrkA [Cyanobacteria bacterium RM1_2_2]|nr:potassium transporter TrkA [Cyanobacteria bacterium RM1_2_2]